MVRDQGASLGGVPAISDEDRSLSYADLSEAMGQAARSLIALGVQPGDRVAVWGPNSAAWIVAALGIHACGAILVPVNTRFKGVEAAYVLRKSGCRALFASGQFLGVDYVTVLQEADAVTTGPLIKVTLPGSPTRSGTLSWETFLDVGSRVSPGTYAKRLRAVRPEAAADVIFTSGTTGHPKGVVLTHGQSLRAYDMFNAGFGLRAGDRYLITNPFFHCFGYKAGWMLSLLVGATVLPHAVFDADAVLARVERDRVSVVAGPPTMYSSLLELPDRHRYDLSSLRYAFTAASTIPVTLVQRMQAELAVAVGTGYGLTESTAIVSVTHPGDDAVTVASTVGSAVEGVDVRIVDDDRITVPEGATGEVAVRGFVVMPGYWDDPGATAEIIDAGGWLYTGDVGAVDGRGNLRLTGRKKDIFIVGGFNVSPVEVENALLANERLAQVAVVGVPDARLGEVAAAWVVPRHGQSVSADDIIAWARDRMANYKVPRYITVVSELPVNAAGKVVKGELRSRAAGMAHGTGGPGS